MLKTASVVRRTCVDSLKKCWPAIRKNAAQIAYYSGVALALCAFAFAAQSIRDRREKTQTIPSLPAVEMEESAQAESEAFIFPQDWTLMREYVPLPEWNAQLGCWQSHPGADVTNEDQTAVSICEGVVRSVGKNGIYGGFVEVESGEVLVRYASVAPAEDLAAGHMLSAGDAIGTMDTSMPAEAHSGAHLHLEIQSDGRCLDPLELMEK